MAGPATGEDASVADAASPVRGGWYAVAVLLVALLLSFTDRFILNLVVDPIRIELSLSDIEVSLLQGAGFAIIFALAGLPCGRLADRVNRRRLIAAGVLLWSAATVACGFATDFFSFFAARLAVGAGEATLIPAASSLIIDLFAPRRRGTALGVFALGATFGTGTALFIGGQLLGLIESGAFASIPFVGGLSSWRILMIVAGLPGLVVAALVLMIREPMRHHAAGFLPLSAVARRLLADNGSVLRVTMVKGALGIGDYGLIAWLPTLLQRVYGLSAQDAGSLLALSITASGAMASLAGGTLSDAFVRRWGTATRVVLLLGCYALALMGAVAVFLAATPAFVGLAFAIWAFGSIGGYVIGHVVMQESVPADMRATTIALSLTATALVGIGLGPSLVPLVAQHVFGSEAALQPAMATVALAAALAACVIIAPPIRRGLAELRRAARPSPSRS
ncbi:MFS transporter [Methylobrevis albus]|uniref:MFS transporter n=1 Tax=Methylobrevis albus TaxID=2793297 RepID=A0A931I256_9HYPH|nr:MFS transporter [Methylobrevis albus]MBH0237903.1 MFS transporter [Methylobrevis albus]